ncbi:galactokinase family protein [Corynebacterium lubricantis]|uniref:galactokinase family protein n=1 Tax=Corynebacterium lubricantis TaxID=541095 RepID=UPI00037CF0BD|nr:galactokinase family protein [Corynebacterium lubricantis]
MPLWTTPDTPPADRVRESHERITGSSPVHIADAPATWVLIGENVDYYGGVTIVGLTQLRAAVAFSSRDDDSVHVTFRTAEVDEAGGQHVREVVGEASLASINDAAPGLGTRYAGIVHNLISRQMLSRETTGMDITVESDIPIGSGMGAMYAADVALALALLADHEDINEAPLRTRIAELCSQAVDTYSTMPVLRARHTAALRGVGETVSVVDYADGSVTQAPHPLRSGVDIFSVAKDLGEPDASQAELIARRRKFIDAATHNFGTESLRSIPDAPARVVEWLQAIHQVRGTDGTPTEEQAHDWMLFSENETLRALAVAKALRSRRQNDLFHLLNTPHDTHGLDTPNELVKLLNLRGARAARPAAAGMSQAVVAFVPVPHTQNFVADLVDDGFYVLPVLQGEVARVVS